MELIMAAQEDNSPWDVPPAAVPDLSASADIDVDSLPGRAYFSQLGVVRRKPARGDAPPCLSKSCSDKIALKQCTSLLSSLTSLLVSPERVYISSLILPESQHSAAACTRCFSAEGRMKPVAGSRWEGGYSFVPFTTKTTRKEFAFSKRVITERCERIAASNLATSWTRNGSELGEGLIGGVLQGTKQLELKGASLVSRRRMWALAKEVAELVEGSPGDLQETLGTGAYQAVKAGTLLRERNQVKEEVRHQALRGWVKNVGDEIFALL